MSFVKWEDKFNTGNYIIDYQHKRLVHLINDLEEIRLDVDFRPFLLDMVFEEVSNYTDYHFKTEEKFMEDTNYSDIEDHKLLHKEFISKLAWFKAECDSKTRRVDQEFCQYLKDWLVNHILTEDPKYMTEMISGHGMV